MHRPMGGQHHKSRVRRTAVKSKVLPLRGADAVDIQAQDGAWAKGFLGGDGRLADAAPQCFAPRDRRLLPMEPLLFVTPLKPMAVPAWLSPFMPVCLSLQPPRSGRSCSA